MTGTDSCKENRACHYFLTLLSAVFFYLSFPNHFSMYGFWPCIWVFAVPLLLALHDQPIKKRLGLGVLWGLCAYGLMAQGLMSISLAGFLAFTLGLSLQSVFFVVFFRSVAPFIYLPLLWCVSEAVRNSLLGGFSFYISHAQAFCPWMLKLYGTVGCWGMSGIIFVVNVLIYLAIIRKQERFNYVIAAAVIFLSVVAAGFFKNGSLLQTGQTFRISVIQAGISPWEKANIELFDRNVQTHLRLTQASSKDHPNLVIWPETAFPDDLLQSDQWRPIIEAQAVDMKADILLGVAPIIDGKEYNSALMINAKGQVAGLYHKRALVPFAENTPLSALGINWGRGYYFSAGNKPGVFKLKDGTMSFGVVICSESAHPGMVRELRRDGAQFLVEISNDGWFTDDASYMLHAQAAIMRAVENRMWVIRAANTGFSFAVDPQGVVHTDRNLKLGHEGFGIFDIMINK